MEKINWKNAVFTKRYKREITLNMMTLAVQSAAKMGSQSGDTGQPDGPSETVQRDHNMYKPIAAGLFAGILALLSVVEANAFTRNGSVSTPRGTASVSASGGCGGGTCSRSVQRTGPYSGSFSRSGSASCNATTGVCAGSSTVTGPNGGTVTRSGSISR